MVTKGTTIRNKKKSFDGTSYGPNNDLMGLFEQYTCTHDDWNSKVMGYLTLSGF